MTPALQTPPPAGSGQGAWGILNSPLFPFAAIIVIMYFMVIAPARKRQKKTQAMLDELKNGDRVITSGGVLGTIVRANKGEDTIRVRIAPTVEIDVVRSAITGLAPESPKGS